LFKDTALRAGSHTQFYRASNTKMVEMNDKKLRRRPLKGCQVTGGCVEHYQLILRGRISHKVLDKLGILTFFLNFHF
jgi:hypothetical protein